MKQRPSGHTLLEAVIAASIFVVVAVALSGVWIMYGKALGKSAEHMGANHLARSVTEGLIANGYEWLKTSTSAGPPDPLIYVMKRQVRGRKADIKYNVAYEAAFNTGVDPAVRPILPGLSQDVCRLTVSVRWDSSTGEKTAASGDFNNVVTYKAFVFKKALN